jgi:curved DNA-binding protein CbpA
MSAPLAGKFQDHYVALAVDPGADSDTIQLAYAKLVEKYGPDNIDTRDDEKLAAIHAAYEVLSNPELRKEFDKIKGVSGDNGRPKFMGLDFFDVLGREVGLRGAVLSILYDRRRNKPFTPALSMRQLEGMLETPSEALSFALWYLKQRNFVANDDKSSLQITVVGMDFLETNRPKPEDVMPFIKLSAIVGSDATEKTEAVKTEVEKTEVPAPAKPEIPKPVPARAALPKLDGNSVRGMLSRSSSQR